MTLTQDSSLIPLDSHGRIACDLSCSRCSYNLRGLPPQGICPECALPIEQSARPNLLRYSDPHWLRALAHGSGQTCVGLLALIVTPWLALLLLFMGNAVLRWFQLPEQFILPLGALLLLGGAGLVLNGVWLITRREPSDGSWQPPRRVAPWVTRVALFISLISWTSVTFMALDRQAWLLDLAVAASLTTWIAALVILGRIADRLSPPIGLRFRILARAKCYLWMGMIVLAVCLFFANMGLRPLRWESGFLMALLKSTRPPILLVIFGVVPLLTIFAIWTIVLLAQVASRLGRERTVAALLDRMMSPADIAGVPLDETGRLADAILCSRCGYDLRGLEPQTVCPECAMPAGRSIREHLQQAAGRGWIADLRDGVTWIIAGFAIGAASALLRMIPLFDPFFAQALGASWYALQPLALPGAIIASAGLWRATPSLPISPSAETGTRSRWIARIAVTAALAAGALPRMGLLFGGERILHLLTPIAAVTGWLALLGYFRTVARRTGREALTANLRTWMWAITALGLVWALLMVWPSISVGLWLPAGWSFPRYGPHWASSPVYLLWQLTLVAALVYVHKRLRPGNACRCRRLTS